MQSPLRSPRSFTGHSNSNRAGSRIDRSAEGSIRTFPIGAGGAAVEPRRRGGAMLKMLLVLAGLVLLVEGIGATLEPSMSVRVEGVVSAPPEKVYRAVSDLRAWEPWFGRSYRKNGGRILHELGAEPTGVGAQLEMIFGDSAHVLVEIEEQRESERVTLRTVSGALDADLTDPESAGSIGARDVIELSEQADGTTLLVWQRIGDPVEARWVRVLDRAVLRRRVEAQVASDVESLGAFASDPESLAWWASLEDSEEETAAESAPASQASGSPDSK